MPKYRVIHGYNNGDVKWCVVCIDDGLEGAPICSPIFDTKEEAERALEPLRGGQELDLAIAGLTEQRSLGNSCA